MSADSRGHSDLHGLVDRLLDGDFGEPERRRLNELLAEADARRYFITYMDVHSRLAWDAGRAAEKNDECRMMRNDECRMMNDEWKKSPSGIHHSSFIVHHFLPTGAMLCYAAASLLLAVAVLAAWAWKTPSTATVEPRPEIAWHENNKIIDEGADVAPRSPPLTVKRATPLVAEVSGMLNCVWANPAGKQRDAAAGRVAIASGLLELTYNTGAKVVLQGPAEYQLEWPNGGVLSAGKVFVRIEKTEKRSASGEKEPGSRRADAPTVPLFFIRTPNAMMTYAGPKDGQYEVSVDKAGGSLTRVVRGAVDLGLKAWWPDPGAVRLEKGESALVDFRSNPEGMVLIFGGEEQPRVLTHQWPKGSPVFSKK